MPTSPSPTVRRNAQPRLHARAARCSILVIVAAGVLSLGGSPALGSTVNCGDTITTDTTLHNDLTNCVGNGLVIGADDIRVNLNGHTVDGNGAEDTCPGEVDFCDGGVNNAAGHRDVSIVGGTIREFELGVLVANADRNVLRELATPRNAVGVVFDHSTDGAIVNGSATDNRFMGVLLVNASNRNVIRSNTVSGSIQTPGVEVRDSDENRVEKNVVEGNDLGIGSSGADHNDFRKNVVTHNLGGGIGTDAGVGNRLRGNVITDNGDGITVGLARDTEISGNVVKRSGFFGAPDTGGFGILLDGSDDDTVDRNVVVDGRGPAIFVTSLDNPETSDRNVISRNIANSKRYDGILVNAAATETLILRNTANGSGLDGINAEATGTTLIRNRANRNHDLGIEAVPGVIDGGGNHAFGNGDPAQCLNIAC